MTGESLKLIAVICMLLDHVAWLWVPVSLPVGPLMHLVGRVTMPIMAFMISEGYVHTHDFRRYAGRLLVFALASDIPYFFFERSTSQHNVMFTLFLGLLAIWLSDHFPAYLGFFAAAMMVLSLWLSLDWSFIGVLLCLIFWRLRGRCSAIIISVVLMAIISCVVYGGWWQIGMVLALPILRCYNGQRGRGSKWGFYVFYPGHLAVLAALRAVV